MTNAQSRLQPKTIPFDGQCLCGCGQTTKPKRNFLQGHDAKLKSKLLKLKDARHPNQTAEPGSRLPDVLVARATVDPTLKVVGYDAKTILTLAAITHSELEPTVVYYPDTQTLVIENGARQVEGEHVAKGVVVFYAEEEKGELDHDVTAITIENAEVTLKPFVDAILSKYDIKSSQQLDAG